MKSWITFILGVSAFTFHWIMTAFHVGPYTPFSTAVQPIQTAYMEPLLAQTWTLFAPEPPIISLSLAYQCELENHEWTPIKEPASELLYKHYKYRISYHGKLLSIVESLARNLNNERVDMVKEAKCPDEPQSECLKKVFISQRKSENYLLAQRFTKDLCIAEFDKILSQKIYVIARSVIPFTKRNDHTEQNVELIDFTL